jgi:hypothetical protein
VTSFTKSLSFLIDRLLTQNHVKVKFENFENPNSIYSCIGPLRMMALQVRAIPIIRDTFSSLFCPLTLSLIKINWDLKICMEMWNKSLESLAYKGLFTSKTRKFMWLSVTLSLAPPANWHVLFEWPLKCHLKITSHIFVDFYPFTLPLSRYFLTTICTGQQYLLTPKGEMSFITSGRDGVAMNNLRCGWIQSLCHF